MQIWISTYHDYLIWRSLTLLHDKHKSQPHMGLQSGQLHPSGSLIHSRLEEPRLNMYDESDVKLLEKSYY